MSFHFKSVLFIISLELLMISLSYSIDDNEIEAEPKGRLIGKRRIKTSNPADEYEFERTGRHKGWGKRSVHNFKSVKNQEIESEPKERLIDKKAIEDSSYPKEENKFDSRPDRHRGWGKRLSFRRNWELKTEMAKRRKNMEKRKLMQKA
jgi:hypothetical protein